jgi:hypothetical protein
MSVSTDQIMASLFDNDLMPQRSRHHDNNMGSGLNAQIEQGPSLGLDLDEIEKILLGPSKVRGIACHLLVISCLTFSTFL